MLNHYEHITFLFSWRVINTAARSCAYSQCMSAEKDIRREQNTLMFPRAPLLLKDSETISLSSSTVSLLPPSSVSAITLPLSSSLSFSTKTHKSNTHCCQRCCMQCLCKILPSEHEDEGTCDYHRGKPRVWRGSMWGIQQRRCLWPCLCLAVAQQVKVGASCSQALWSQSSPMKFSPAHDAKETHSSARVTFQIWHKWKRHLT